MLDDVIQRLKSLGYEYDEGKDGYIVNFLITKATDYVLDFCNIASIPDRFNGVVVDMVCGEFLQTMKNMGLIDIETIDFDDGVSSISEGDTKVSFEGVLTPEQRFDLLMNQLVNGNRNELITYRRIRW